MKCNPTSVTKTKHLLIGTAKKLYHSEITTLKLSIHNARLEESVGEKHFGVVIDSDLRFLRLQLTN